MTTPLLFILFFLSLASATAEDGARVYRENCATCHGVAGHGDGPTARHVWPRPADLSRGEFKYRSTLWAHPPTDADLKRTVRRGIPGTSMPGFTWLSDEQVTAVVEHVKHLSTRWESPLAILGEDSTLLDVLGALSNPDLFETVGELSSQQQVLAQSSIIFQQIAFQSQRPTESSDKGRGEQLYQTTCAICHGSDGRGRGPAAADFHPRNFRREALRGGSRPEDIFRTISYGLEGTVMPPFISLEADDRWALVAYIQSLLPSRSPHAVGVHPRPQ
jgi:mono/diheme cytochrome c family protein